ncbi:MAG: hypothetical protein HQ483_10835 [Rhodospirillales bacterium]|nr:hypothetical protein [Rhodospirillales bacterium]
MNENDIARSVRIFFAALLFAIPGQVATAASPTALVEEVSAARTDVMVMDMLEPGHVIVLAGGETLTLGYLTSCRQETITGGRITVGRVESTVDGGQVTVKMVACDSAQTVGSGNEAGAVVFRAPPNDKVALQAERTVYSLYPILKTDAAVDTAVLARLDRNEKEISIHLVNGVADLRKLKKKLARNGYYRISAANRETVFRVHATAKSSEKALLSRFVAF